MGFDGHYIYDALDWIRENKGIDSWVESPHPKTMKHPFKAYHGKSVWFIEESKRSPYLDHNGNQESYGFVDTPMYYTHSEALTALLDAILEMI